MGKGVLLVAGLLCLVVLATADRKFTVAETVGAAAPGGADKAATGDKKDSENFEDVFNGTDSDDDAPNSIDSQEEKAEKEEKEGPKPKASPQAAPKQAAPKQAAPKAAPPAAKQGPTGGMKEAPHPTVEVSRNHAGKAPSMHSVSTNHPEDAKKKEADDGVGPDAITAEQVDDGDLDKENEGAIDDLGNRVSQKDLEKSNNIKSTNHPEDSKKKKAHGSIAPPTEGTPDHPILWNEVVVPPPRGQQGPYESRVTEENPQSLVGVIPPPSTEQYMAGAGGEDAAKIRTMLPPTAKEANNAAEKQWDEWKRKEKLDKERLKIKKPPATPPPEDDDVPPMPEVKVTETEQTKKARREAEAKKEDALKAAAGMKTGESNPNDVTPAGHGKGDGSAAPEMDSVPPVPVESGAESDDDDDTDLGEKEEDDFDKEEDEMMNGRNGDDEDEEMDEDEDEDEDMPSEAEMEEMEDEDDVGHYLRH